MGRFGHGMSYSPCMNQKLVGLLAAVVVCAVSPRCARSACSSDTLATWDITHLAFAWETNLGPQQVSLPGSVLTVVGTFASTCGAWSGLGAASPDSELTWVIDGPISAGTVFDNSQFHVTILRVTYLGGILRIYHGSPRNAPPQNAFPANPPNAEVPGSFEDGALVYEAQLDSVKTAIGFVLIGSSSGGASMWGHALAGPLATVGEPIYMAAKWCHPACTSELIVLPSPPVGYPWESISGVVSSSSSVPVRRTTWGSVKRLYR